MFVLSTAFILSDVNNITTTRVQWWGCRIFEVVDGFMTNHLVYWFQTWGLRAPQKKKSTAAHHSFVSRVSIFMWRQKIRELSKNQLFETAEISSGWWMTRPSINDWQVGNDSRLFLTTGPLTCVFVAGDGGAFRVQLNSATKTGIFDYVIICIEPRVGSTRLFLGFMKESGSEAQG